uniref:Uncharacterized protein n=1 Tax=viral metagenome TaxID=1070528 RepID=A0A6C0F707_9ZZZZ
MPRNKGNIKAGQRGRAVDKNKEAIGELLKVAEAAKKEWDAKPPEWRSANPFIPDPLLAVVRIIAWPSTEWYTVKLPSGQLTQVRGLDKGVSHQVAQLCKQCKQAQEDSETWPTVIVSLPEQHASRKTGEILAVLDPDDVSQFAALNFKVPTSDSDDGGYVFAPHTDNAAAGGGGGGGEYVDPDAL